MVLAEREGIMHRLFDRIIGVAHGAVDMRDRVAGGAGDPSLSSRILLQVIVGIVERAAEKGNQIIAPGTPS